MTMADKRAESWDVAGWCTAHDRAHTLRELVQEHLDTARDAVPTHGRHCPCSACKREDWTNPTLAHCGMHGPDCPPVYAPFTARDAVPDQRCCSQENPHRAIPTITDRPRVARHWFDEAQAFPHPAARGAEADTVLPAGRDLRADEDHRPGVAARDAVPPPRIAAALDAIEDLAIDRDYDRITAIAAAGILRAALTTEDSNA